MNESIEKKFSKLIEIMNRLRKECPWDKKQTAASLRQYILEETYEVIESIDNNDHQELQKELGDLLLQIVFQSVIAEEKKQYSIEDVIDNINKKLIERHPHVFAETIVKSAKDVADNWEHIKYNSEGRKSIIDGIPKQAPALLYAQRMQEKASKIGFDWEVIKSVVNKLDEEVSELKSVLAEGNQDKIEKEMGDTFFTLVNICRFLNINAEDSLRETNAKFKRRFQFIENYYNGDINKMKQASLAELDSLWEKAKVEI